MRRALSSDRHRRRRAGQRNRGNSVVGRSRRARHAASQASIGARDDGARLALDLAALSAGRALRAIQRAAGARFANDAAVVVEAGEGAFAAGRAGAAAVGAAAGAGRVVALAGNVARRRRAIERAHTPDTAATVAVGADAAAGSAVAIDVARGSGAAKPATAVVAARAAAVRTGAGAIVVVAFADHGAGWRRAVEIARVAGVADAAPAVALVVVIAARGQPQRKTEQDDQWKHAKLRSSEHGARALHGCASGQSSKAGQRERSGAGCRSRAFVHEAHSRARRVSASFCGAPSHAVFAPQRFGALTCWTSTPPPPNSSTAPGLVTGWSS